MICTKALVYSGIVVTLAAGCQQKTVYTPDDIAPSQFVMGLPQGQGGSAPAPVVASETAAEIDSVPIVYEEATEVQPTYSVIETAEPIMPAPLETEVGFVEQTTFTTESAAPEVASTEITASEITYIDETEALPAVETMAAPEPAYVIDSGGITTASSELITESELAVLDAPALDNDIVPVLGNAAAPTVIDSAPLPQPGVTPYGQAL